MFVVPRLDLDGDLVAPGRAQPRLRPRTQVQAGRDTDGPQEVVEVGVAFGVVAQMSADAGDEGAVTDMSRSPPAP